MRIARLNTPAIPLSRRNKENHDSGARRLLSTGPTFTLAKLSIGRSRTTNELVSDYRGSPTADAADWRSPAKESGSK